MAEYELGVDRGVFYLPGRAGEPWNGLSNVLEDPVGVDGEARYIDGVKHFFRNRVGSFSGKIQAFTYPDSFYDHILVKRIPPLFGFSYRISEGDHYKIHLVYNLTISPEGISRKTFDIDAFVWDFTTRPVPVPGSRVSAHLVIDSSIAYPSTMQQLEDILYGSDVASARLPLPEEILDIFEENAIVKVIDHGDGTFTITGPDSAVYMTGPTSWEVNWPSAVWIDEDTYTVSSL